MMFAMMRCRSTSIMIRFRSCSTTMNRLLGPSCCYYSSSSSVSHLVRAVVVVKTTTNQLFVLQPQPPQILRLSRVVRSNNNRIITGCYSSINRERFFSSVSAATATMIDTVVVVDDDNNNNNNETPTLRTNSNPLSSITTSHETILSTSYPIIDEKDQQERRRNNNNNYNETKTNSVYVHRTHSHNTNTIKNDNNKNNSTNNTILRPRLLELREQIKKDKALGFNGIMISETITRKRKLNHQVMTPTTNNTNTSIPGVEQQQNDSDENKNENNNTTIIQKNNQQQRLQSLLDQLPDPPNEQYHNNNNNNTNNQNLHNEVVVQQKMETKNHPPVIRKNPILTDTFHRTHNYLRISITERCNFRCTYCMPEEGIDLNAKEHLLTTNELLKLVQYFTNHGITKIRITGGEPTLNPDIITIIQQIRIIQRNAKIPINIGMTTNGFTLQKQLHAMIQAGLTSINISFDTMIPTKFATLTRRPISYYHKVWESIQQSIQAVKENQKQIQQIHHHCNNNTKSKMNAGTDQQQLLELKPIKINVVLMRNVNDDEMNDFLKVAHFYKSYLQIRFIEYMPFTKNGWKNNLFIPYQEILQQINHVNNHDNHPQNSQSSSSTGTTTATRLTLSPIPSSDPSDTTKWYTTTPVPHTNQEEETNHQPTNNNNNVPNIGFITSMSNHFCSTCNRLRLTTDGQIKVCLFDGTHETNTISLRDILRYSTTTTTTGTSSSTSTSSKPLEKNQNINDDDNNMNNDKAVLDDPYSMDPIVSRNLNKVIYHAVQKKHEALGGHTNPEHIMADAENNRPMTLIGG